MATAGFCDETDKMSPPDILIIPQRLYVSMPFTVLIRMGAEWRASHRLTSEDVWNAGIRAALFLEDDHSSPVKPCQRCCKGKAAVLKLGISDLTLFGPRPADENKGVEVYSFDRCRSYCASSRLHLGGKVVIGMTFIRLADGNTVATADSPPIELCSKVPHKLRKQMKTGSSPVESSISGISPGGRQEPASAPEIKLETPVVADPSPAALTGLATNPFFGLSAAGFALSPLLSNLMPTIPRCDTCGADVAAIIAQYQLLKLQTMQLEFMLRKHQEHTAAQGINGTAAPESASESPDAAPHPLSPSSSFRSTESADLDEPMMAGEPETPSSFTPAPNFFGSASVSPAL